MKIKKNNLKTKQLLHLQIIKYRIYENTFINKIPLSSVSNLIISFKKSFNIIFRYHKQKKRILFLGIPKPIEQRINVETNHIALPNFFNIYGVFVNNFISKNLKLKYQFFKNKNKITFSKLLYKPDLIVIFNINPDKEVSILKESYKTKIPVIKFNSYSNSKKKNNFFTYEVPGNFNFHEKATNEVFFKIINSILNK